MNQENKPDAGYRVKNPATGEVVEAFESASDDQIQEALVAGDTAFGLWADKTIAERAAITTRVSELFGERKEDLAKIIAEEMGKPVAEGVGEAEFAADIFKYFADNGPDFVADQEIKTFSGGKAFIQRLPVGLLLGIMPWNFPFYQVARFVAPNLMLGNTILLKHAELCPRSALAIRQILEDAGVPQGVYQNVFATHDQISDIIADPRVQGVSLTGSERAGAIVGEQAGKHLKKAVLELGGSDPYVVLDADDVKASAQTAWETRMYNTGQACNSNKRIIVLEDIYDEFLAELVDLASQMKPGSPEDDSPFVYSPLSSRGAAELLSAQVQKAVDEGAQLHTGGTLGADGTAYFAPGVLTDVTSSMNAYREELFGPMVVLYKVRSDEEAIALANDTPYGLGGAVFSTDTARAERLAQKLEVGMANVNTPAGEGAELPFGGVKRSGFGRELGPLGMDEFVNKRLYYVEG